MAKSRKSANPVTERRLRYLATGEGFMFIDYRMVGVDGPLETLWRRHGATITREHIKTSPCTRPHGWWRYSAQAPDEYRRVLSGTAYGELGPTPPDSLEHVQRFEKIGEAGVRVESEPAFLLRHGILTAGEIEHLKMHPELLEPITCRPFDPGYPYNWQPCECRGEGHLPIKLGYRIERCPKCGECFYTREAK